METKDLAKEIKTEIKSLQEVVGRLFHLQISVRTTKYKRDRDMISIHVWSDLSSHREWGAGYLSCHFKDLIKEHRKEIAIYVG
jgi:hypothetical protein